jgi:hypothetical protein
MQRLEVNWCGLLQNGEFNPMSPTLADAQSRVA